MKLRPVTNTKPASLYDGDFHRWTAEQAHELRQRRAAGIDWENVAEEIESLGRSDKRSIESNLSVILVHLLKWQQQSGKRNASWEVSLAEHRTRLRKLTGESPSLRDYPAKMLDEEYALARLKAAAETGIPKEDFPEACPFTIAEVLDLNFLPDAAKD